jgi:transcriptional regulatory protein LevR
MEPTEEIYSLVERSIDAAFNEKFIFDLYTYVKGYKFTRRQVSKFIESTTAASISDTVLELELYLKGKDTIAKQAYGHLSKPKARKIKDYLYKILNDAWKYEQERRPGRKPGSKTKKRKQTVTNK